MSLRFLFLAMICLSGTPSFGQVTEQIFEPGWQERFFDNTEEIIPLLVQQAMESAPELAHNEAAQQIAIENKEIARKEISSGLAFGGGYRYGTLINLVGTDAAGGAASVNPFAIPAVGLYNIGFTASLPLDRIISRKNKINVQEMNLVQAKAQEKIEVRLLREKVILLYQEIAVAKAELELRQEALQSANIHYQMAEKQLHDGEILITDMARINEIYSAAAIGHGTAKVRYQTSFMMLEELIDMRIVDFMNFYK